MEYFKLSSGLKFSAPSIYIQKKNQVGYIVRPNSRVGLSMILILKYPTGFFFGLKLYYLRVIFGLTSGDAVFFFHPYLSQNKCWFWIWLWDWVSGWKPEDPRKNSIQTKKLGSPEALARSHNFNFWKFPRHYVHPRKRRKPNFIII